MRRCARIWGRFSRAPSCGRVFDNEGAGALVHRLHLWQRQLPARELGEVTVVQEPRELFAVLGEWPFGLHEQVVQKFLRPSAGRRVRGNELRCSGG